MGSMFGLLQLKPIKIISVIDFKAVSPSSMNHIVVHGSLQGHEMGK